jgi:glycerol-3-phosphate acyltransferase PlsX
VIGLNKIAVKTHGSADEQQFASALRLTYDCVNSQIVNKIKGSL